MKNESVLQKKFDPDLFHTRLSELLMRKGMVDKKGKPDHIQLYKALYSNKTSEKNDELPLTRTDYEQSARTQRNWLDGSSKPKSWNIMTHLCNVLECDMEYLMGYDSQYSSRDEQFVCEYLGLSRNVVSKIHEMSQYASLDNSTIGIAPTPGGAFEHDEPIPWYFYTEFSKRVIDGIELIFKDREPASNDNKLYSRITRDYSTILELISILIKGKPEYMGVSRISIEEFAEHVHDEPHGNYAMLKKDGVTIHEYNDIYDEIVFELSKYDTIGLVDKFSIHRDVNLKDIVEKMTREEIMDILKDMENQPIDNNQE